MHTIVLVNGLLNDLFSKKKMNPSRNSTDFKAV